MALKRSWQILNSKYQGKGSELCYDFFRMTKMAANEDMVIV